MIDLPITLELFHLSLALPGAVCNGTRVVFNDWKKIDHLVSAVDKNAKKIIALMFNSDY